MLGMNSHLLNPYSSEKSLISKSIKKLRDFNTSFRILSDEINSREKASEKYLRELPNQMSTLFDELDQLVVQAETNF